MPENGQKMPENGSKTPKNGDFEMSFKEFLMLLYKCTYPGGNYHENWSKNPENGIFGAKNAQNGSKMGQNGEKMHKNGEISAEMRDTDLFRLLNHAYSVVESDFSRFDIDGDRFCAFFLVFLSVFGCFFLVF
jgi:hypothetical protein